MVRKVHGFWTPTGWDLRPWGFPCDWASKESICSIGDTGDVFNPWAGKIPWRRKWQPTPVFLPGESHGQRSLAGYSPWGRKELDTTEHINSLPHTAKGLWAHGLTLPNMKRGVPHLCGGGTWLSPSVVVRGRCLIKVSSYLLCWMSVVCAEKSQVLLDPQDITRGCLHMLRLLSCWLENTGSCPQGPLFSSFILNIIHLFDCATSLIVIVAFRVFSCSMWDLVPWPRMEPRPLALGLWSLGHWTTREVPPFFFFPFSPESWLMLMPASLLWNLPPILVQLPKHPSLWASTESSPYWPTKRIMFPWAI